MRSLSSSGWRSVLVPPSLKRRRVYVPAALLLCALIGTGIYLARRQPAPPELAFSDFLQQIDHGAVRQVLFADGTITLTLRDGSAARTVPPPNYLISDAFMA